jgi:class 3 adenylate cyclase
VRTWFDTDVRHLLGAIQAPTLVMHGSREGDAQPEQSRYVADRIPGARLSEFPELESTWWGGAQERITAAVREFVTDVWEEGAPASLDRVLATVLFTDLVGSTEKSVSLGPRWQEVLREHNAAIRRELAHFRGREIDTAGDGFFASGFDGPARAIRCGCAIRDVLRPLGLGVRIGVHTGECDLVDGKLAGVTVAVGARIAAQAQADEVLVSSTVKDLVAGSGIEFEPRGTRELKGVGDWQLYAVGHT